jgi:phosphatidylserine/phosphatidylglycerophosphate/cardiolipin synthase-like enzyme
MHAKTVLVDGWRWLVTSANFTDRGQERNFELGALIEDRETGASVMRWFEEGIGAGFFVRLR